jgi:hypothetical protein
MSETVNHLLDQLHAAVAETEQLARRVPGDLRTHHWTHPGPWVMNGNGGGDTANEVARAVAGGTIGEAIAEHIAHNNPLATLTRSAAHRTLLGMCRAAIKAYERGDGDTDFQRGQTAGAYLMASITLTHLAEGYGITDVPDTPTSTTS